MPMNGDNGAAPKQALSTTVEAKIIKDFFCEDTQETLLPSERELCEKYEVSRITLRESICSLEVQGYLQRLHGKGIERVDHSKEVTIRSLHSLIQRRDIDYRQLLEVRFLLESRAARLAAIYASDADIAFLTDCLHQMSDFSSDYDAYLVTDLQFHERVAVASQNVLLETLVEALTEPLRQCILRYTRRDLRLETSYQFHEKLLSAIRMHNAEEAEKQMIRHLLSTENIVEDGAHSHAKQGGSRS